MNALIQLKRNWYEVESFPDGAYRVFGPDRTVDAYDRDDVIAELVAQERDESADDPRAEADAALAAKGL